jgi:AcrR family transcriptional regulator
MTDSGDLAGVRERIFAAARDELAERGFAAASVRTIAQNAGVTAAMINYYFGGKRALYDALVAEAQTRLHARLIAAVGGGRDGAAARLAGAYFDFLAEERPMQRLLLREALDAEGHANERGPELVRPLRAILEAQFGGDEESTQLALSLFGAIAGYFIYEPFLHPLLGEDPLSPSALARRRQHIVSFASMIQETRS